MKVVEQRHGLLKKRIVDTIHYDGKTIVDTIHYDSGGFASGCGEAAMCGDAVWGG